MTLDYGKFLEEGFQERMGRLSGDSWYTRQVKLVMQGIESLVNRIVEALKASGHLEKEKRIAEFERMLDGPALSFEEAMQRILFLNQIMWQTRHRLNGFGHLDWYLEPFYEKDISSGKITRQDVDRMLDDFFLKLSRHSYYKADALVGDIGQIIVLGGIMNEDTYRCNNLTEQILGRRQGRKSLTQRQSCA